MSINLARLVTPFTLAALLLGPQAHAADVSPGNLEGILERTEGCARVTVSTFHQGREHFDEEVENAEALIEELEEIYGDIDGLEPRSKEPLFEVIIGPRMLKTLESDSRVQGILMQDLSEEGRCW